MYIYIYSINIFNRLEELKERSCEIKDGFEILESSRVSFKWNSIFFVNNEW